LRFAISKTSDPALGGWYQYAAPNIGFLDQDKISATSDKFLVAGNTSSSEVIYVYNVADLLNGVGNPQVATVTAKKSNVYQAVVEQSTTSNAYFVSSFPGNLLYMATVTGTPAAHNVVLTEARVPASDWPPPQNPQVPGGSYDGGDGRILDAVYEVESSDGKPVIQYSSTRQCGSRDCLTSARIDLSGTKPVLTYDTLVGEPGWDYTYGAVGLDAAGNVFEAYSRSGALTAPGSGVVGPGFDVTLQSATPGATTCAAGNPPCLERWGDYLGAAFDPSDPSSVWLAGLYQAGNGGFMWGTLVARVSTTTFSLPTAVTGSAKISGTSATLKATVNPNGVATTYHFDYGLTTGYDSTTTEQNAGAGSVAVPVSAKVTGLQIGTTYHYRIVATTSAGSAVGLDHAFRSSAKITSVRFTGTSANPTVTITGSNFGAEPASTPAGCGATGSNFGTSLWFKEVTQGWAAGQGGDCIALVVSSYTTTQIVYQFGSFYNTNGLGPANPGDHYQVSVYGSVFSGTVVYS
jgi:hypothetical protein